MIDLINALPLEKVENLISNLIVASDLVIDSNFELHVAIEDQIARLLDSLDQRFEVIG